MSKTTFLGGIVTGCLGMAVALSDMEIEKKSYFFLASLFVLSLFFFFRSEKKPAHEKKHTFNSLGLPTLDNIAVSIEGVIQYTTLERDNLKDAQYNESVAIHMIQDMVEGYLYTQVKNMSFEDLLLNREHIQGKLLEVLNKKIVEWGLKIDYILLQHIDLSPEMKKAILETAVNNFTKKQKAISEGEMIKQVSAAIPQGQGSATHYILVKRYIDTLGNLASSQNNKVVFMPFETNKILEQFETVSEFQKELVSAPKK